MNIPFQRAFAFKIIQYVRKITAQNSNRSSIFRSELIDLHMILVNVKYATVNYKWKWVEFGIDNKTIYFHCSPVMKLIVTSCCRISLVALHRKISLNRSYYIPAFH